MTLTGAYEHGRHRPWHEPTQAQKEAGNYRKPTLTLYFDLHVAIENPVGSVRHGIDPNGEPWQTRMVYPYGYILGSRGVDGDGVDCYVGSNPEAPMVYVIHQRKAGDWSAYDEDKAMLCFDSQADAERAYLLHYNDERFLGPITIMPIDKFKEKVLATRDKPAMIKSTWVDLAGLSCDCTDHALDVLSKAISEDGADIWAAHENPFISHLVELFTDRGLLRTDKVKTEFDAWMAGNHYEHRLDMVPRPGMMPYWTKPELGLVKTYLENIHPSLYTLEDWDYLISYLIQRYLPVDELMTDAEWLVSRSYLLGKAQAHLGTITPLVADTLMTALPLTIAQAGITFRLADAEQQILSYGKLHACEAVVSMTDVARHSLKRVVLDHMAKVASGDQAVTTGQLQQQLFDNFASMNRDWRRIATTEATELSGQGVIASLPAGAKVRRMEMYHGACGFCKKIDGMIFNVVDPAKPDKDDWADMWVGKNNIGRSGSPRKRTENGLELRQPHELWIPVPGANHPHCRGQLIPLNNGEAVTDDFSRWFYEMVSK